MSFTITPRKGLNRCLVDDDLPANALAMHLSHLAPGACAHAAHTHESAEAFYILEGQATVEVEGIRHQLIANEAMILDARKSHAISNSGTTTLRYLVSIVRNEPKA